MRPPQRRRTFRTARFESVEQRLVLSSNPLNQFVSDYVAQQQIGDEVYPALVDAAQLTGLAEVRDEYGFTGEGQTVVVIDSGIAYSHTALGEGFGADYRVVGGYDFTGGTDADPYDEGPYGSHGTHVAGIIASDDAFHPGVAPGVDLVALRVFGDNGRGSYAWVEQALAWVHENRDAFANPITTVNLSVGKGFNPAGLPADAILEDELAQLEADGIFIAVAAGNSFTQYNTTGLSYPAASSHVVPVGSVDPNGQLSYFSQRDQRIIAAPGRSISSTVPDYLGDFNGIDDDFGKYSGTSMAAPYVAGASVLIRQAYEFVGLPDVDQEKIYDLMVSTADVIRDDATGLDYHRLNISRALDRIMPEDDFGSTAADAHRLGSISGFATFNGYIGHLDDRDFFTFTAATSGRIGFTIDTTDQMVAEWSVVGQPDVLADADGSLGFDVTAGATYTVGLGSQDGLGSFTVDVTLDSGDALPQAQLVTQTEFLDNQINTEGKWFGFTASRQGILTIEATFAHSRGNVDLGVFDDAGNRLATANSKGDSERVDVTVRAGQTVYVHARLIGSGVNPDVDLKVTNLVSHDGQTVSVSGTEGDDRFTFSAGATHQIVINGVSYDFSAHQVSNLYFDGLAGSDSAILNGTMTSDTAVLRVGSADLRGSGYHVSAASVEDVTVVGGGGLDYASLYDSAGDDTLRAMPDETRLSGKGFSLTASGFTTVHAYALSGGFDVAHLYGSTGSDTFVATPTFGKLFGSGYFRRAKFFEGVHAYAGPGGNDTARLYGSAGNDVFTATPIYGKLSGEGYLNRAKFFGQVTAWAGAGGVDRALLYDSAGNDTFVASPNSALLKGSRFANHARRFDTVYAFAGKGHDVAQLHGSSGNDTLLIDGADARLFGSGFYNRARSFDQVHVYAGQSGQDGQDRALLHDTALDDHFQAQGNRAMLSNTAYTVWIHDFDYVHATASLGGSDHAEVDAVDYVLELLGDWE
jgi:subtilase family protein